MSAILGDLHTLAPERVANAMEALAVPAILLGLLGVSLLVSSWIHCREAGDFVDTLKTSLEAGKGPDFRPLR